MCKDCGCGLPGEQGLGISAHHHEHGPHHDHSSHSHHHGHDHDHNHDHDHHDEDEHHQERGRRTIELRQSILAQNDRLAERNRGFFRARGILAANIVSSPGSGKTTLLRETLKGLRTRLQTAVVVGDLATDNDAERLRESGAPVIQVTTGTVCHLDASMVAQAVKRLKTDGLQVLIIENVGNLVCPASYDLGEDLRVVLLSVTEGEDKPLKYPPIFQAADAVIISKTDIAETCGFQRETALQNVKRVAPGARVLELSAKTGQGMEAWLEFLVERQQQARIVDPLAL